MKKIILGLALTYLSAFSFSQINVSDVEKQCEAGNLNNCTGIGEVYLYGGYGIKRNYSKAAKFLQKGCDGGDNEACHNLAKLYNEGLGVRKSYKEAIILYDKACNGGIASSCSSLGIMYESGKGVKKNVAKGVEYYRKSCDAGGWDGCGNYASYNHGIGNMQIAAKYYQKACELGAATEGIGYWSDEGVANVNKKAWQPFCDRYKALR